VVSAADINSRGEIVGTAVDQSSGEPLAFLAIPVADSAAQLSGNSIPNAPLSEGVRKLLQRRWVFRAAKF